MTFSEQIGNGVARDVTNVIVIVARRFRLERELTAYVLRKLRPATTVLTTDLPGLVDLCRKTSPVLVICDEPSEFNATACDAWILMDPLQPGLSTVSIDNQICHDVRTNLDTVLSIFDRSVRLRTDT